MAIPKILLVDDTKLFLKLEQEYLKQSAAQIFTAGNGQEALELARSNRPDLIYLDLNMPVMDGVGCCAALKADPDLRDIPVILVTTAGMDDSVARCKEAGASGYLLKDQMNSLLVQAIKTLSRGGTFFIPETRKSA